MTNKFFLSIILFIVLSVSVFAQNEQIASVYHNIHKINSKTLNEERSVWVRVPLKYSQTGEKFPVVYMLDGHAPQPSMMAGIIEQQAWGGKMPEMILVSIQNTNRSRDLTPTNDKNGGRETGGADKFLQFIEKEVMPLIEKNYRTQPFKIFAGHSLGGLTVVYSFATRPDLFDAYIAASPVLQYDDYFVIKETEKLFGQKRDLEKTMFLGLGDEPDYKNGWNKFQKLLKDEKPKNFEYEFREFADDNHPSVVLPVYYHGLRKIFDGWSARNAKIVSDLENHYKKLSKRFGYEIIIPEDTLTFSAYQYLQQKLYDEAIKLFKKTVEYHPDSANAHNALGEALEEDGQFKQAAESFKKALELARRQNDENFSARIKASLDRVSEKLK